MWFWTRLFLSCSQQRQAMADLVIRRCLSKGASSQRLPIQVRNNHSNVLRGVAGNGGQDSFIVALEVFVYNRAEKCLIPRRHETRCRCVELGIATHVL